MRRLHLEQFQEKCAAVFRQESRKNKKIERFRDSKKSGNAPVLARFPENGRLMTETSGEFRIAYHAAEYGPPLMMSPVSDSR
jgi:hypothetical protein